MTDSNSDMNLSVGVLSWRAPETLRRTLSTYRHGRLTDCAREAVVFFNEVTDADEVPDTAKADGWKRAGNARNLGLLGGMDALARTMTGDYLLMLQNDCPLVADAATTRRYLSEAVKLIADGKADIVRCRSRSFPGQGFADAKKYARYHGDGWRPAVRRFFRPEKARRMIGRAPYAVPDAERRFPDYITREGGFLVVDSAVINFTDQPFLISRTLMLDLLDWAKAHPKKRTLNGFQVLELNLNTAWWRQQHFKIAVGEGLFTHARLDGGFRENTKSTPERECAWTMSSASSMDATMAPSM